MSAFDPKRTLAASRARALPIVWWYRYDALSSASGEAMRRREFIKVIAGSAVAWPLASHAQQPEQVRRIGVLIPLAADDPEGKARLAAFLQGLQQLGWDDGRNVRIDTRW